VHLAPEVLGDPDTGLDMRVVRGLPRDRDFQGAGGGERDAGHRPPPAVGRRGGDPVLLRGRNAPGRRHLRRLVRLCGGFVGDARVPGPERGVRAPLARRLHRGGAGPDEGLVLQPARGERHRVREISLQERPHARFCARRRGAKDEQEPRQRRDPRGGHQDQGQTSSGSTSSRRTRPGTTSGSTGRG